ncbi:MAG: hypothetical protein IJ840_06350 [Bacteroidales bacterium]|nr:hypothetical protein [Bacteroidales bacterium]
MRLHLHNILHTILRGTAILSATLALSFCDGKDPDIGINDGGEGVKYTSHGNRKPTAENRRVLLFYECGFNSLYDYLQANMEVDLPKGTIPGNGRHDDVLLVFSKLAANLNYKDVPSYLRRLYTNQDGELVSDTLKTYSPSTVASSGETMRDVLNFVRESFPAKGYGMVYASHGSGWLPNGYYNNPSAYERKNRSGSRNLSKAGKYLDIPEGSMETDDPYAFMVRSIGQDKMSSGDKEMSTYEFADGIPFHLDYILFDMCFSGGIEVAYALKDKADYLGISPAEVLAAGMYDYEAIISYLFHDGSTDLTGLYKDSFDRYDKRSGDYRSSTVTLLKTEGLDEVATVCADLISKYSGNIANAPASQIQGYFRQNRHYFYDLVDIFGKSGVPDEALSPLRSALDRCIVYKAATPSFISSFQIKTYSGVSMYLPCAGTALLDASYKDEPWNKAVNLVK